MRADAWQKTRLGIRMFNVNSVVHLCVAENGAHSGAQLAAQLTQGVVARAAAPCGQSLASMSQCATVTSRTR